MIIDNITTYLSANLPEVINSVCFFIIGVLFMVIINKITKVVRKRKQKREEEYTAEKVIEEIEIEEKPSVPGETLTAEEVTEVIDNEKTN